MTTRYFGASVKRNEDHRLLTGDEDAIRSAAQSSAEELFARRRRQMRAAHQG